MNYFKESVEEIKKVTWPTQKHAIQITIITIAITAVATAALTFVDGALQKGYGKLLDMSPKSNYQNLVQPADLGIDTADIQLKDAEGNPVDEAGFTITPVTPEESAALTESAAE
mgnify:CR=1 FL=1